MPRRPVVPKRHFQLSKERFCEATSRRKCTITGGIYVAQCTEMPQGTILGLRNSMLISREIHSGANQWNKWTRLLNSPGLQWLTASIALWCKKCHRVTFRQHYAWSFTDRTLSRTDGDRPILSFPNPHYTVDCCWDWLFVRLYKVVVPMKSNFEDRKPPSLRFSLILLKQSALESSLGSPTC